jgi:Tol biopolymer transport system component
VYTVAFSPDGKRLAAASNREVKVWDAATGQEVFSYLIKGTNVFGLAFSPDGKRLAVGISHQVKILDAGTGQELTVLAGANHFLFRMAFSPDGKHLAASGGSTNGTGAVSIWEVESGKYVRSLSGAAEAVLTVAYSRDSGLLAAAGGLTSGVRPGTVVVWEAATGRMVHTLRGHEDNVYGVAFSPDGRRLASAGGVRGSLKPGSLKLWEVATGQEVCRLTAHTGPAFGVVFSPDGRYLATAGADRAVKVWEVLTGKEVLSLAAHDRAVYSLAFSPDGQRLATASADRTVKVWNVAGWQRPPSASVGTLTGKELEERWTELASGDAVRAYRSMGVLGTAPGQTIPLLRDRLRPVAGLSAGQRKQVEQWLRDLDDDQFEVRQNASAELGRLGEAILGPLTRVLAGDPSLEVRRRALRLLEGLGSVNLSGGQLAALRAVELLERIGTREAAAILKALAGGLPEARLTRDARASLERLERASGR